MLCLQHMGSQKSRLASLNISVERIHPEPNFAVCLTFAIDQIWIGHLPHRRWPFPLLSAPSNPTLALQVSFFPLAVLIFSSTTYCISSLILNEQF